MIRACSAAAIAMIAACSGRSSQPASAPKAAGAPQTTGALASLLPQVIDKLSPGGKVPGGNDLGGALGKLLG